MKKLLLLEPIHKKGNYQFFMDWFAQAWQAYGGTFKYRKTFPWFALLLVARLKLSANISLFSSRKKAFLVPCAGYPDSFAWPYAYTHEIIPMLWDVWPRYWPRLISSLKRHHVQTLLCTSSQVCEYVAEKLPYIHAIHVPEGIDPTGYRDGGALEKRRTDILQIGRLMKPVHEAILQMRQSSPHLSYLYPEEPGNLVFPDFPSLCEGLASSKIVICYPRCRTHPEMAGDVETLTQRYWECMLSGTLIVGHAPKELVDLLGYNPVIELQTDGDISNQLSQILNNIAHYQELVYKNLVAARAKASWNVRMDGLLQQLRQLGYAQ